MTEVVLIYPFYCPTGVQQTLVSGGYRRVYEDVNQVMIKNLETIEK